MAYFPHFRGKILFSKNLALSCTIPEGHLDHAEFQKKLKSQFQQNFQTGGIDVFIGPFWPQPGYNKGISQLRGIAEDNKNNIQYNLAYHNSLT